MAPRYQRSPQIRLCPSIPDRKVQSECAPVAREAKAKHLAERCSQPTRTDQLPGVQIVLISADAVGLIEASERQVGFEGIVGEPNAGFIIRDSVVRRGNLWTSTERFSQDLHGIDDLDLSLGLRFLNEVELQRGQRWILIHADSKTKCLLRLLKSVFALDGLQPASSHLRLRAIDIERRQCAELQGTLVMLIAAFSQGKRLPFDVEASACLDNGPVLCDNLQDGVIPLRLKSGPRLLKSPPVDEERSRIGKPSGITQERLSKLQGHRGADVRIKKVKVAVGGSSITGQTGEYIRSSHERLRVTGLHSLTKRIHGSGGVPHTLQLRIT